ncbi:uncharacterized protein LOC126789942 isoform X1 [Argentina anserina]|uniref:uncharacterized protein LOC126789942 isoform X1 n=1 Tax=Argentina anserina TaxID=57926 RepID=UPI0021761FF7|nr:uncharacterized protein LOC126789942 isoform X1 [Potentilla anserina]XP_050371994.1 uncharacterized protein LOC126789942 isoform X2 [Potentilla anserina]XP_050372003.1 uncharacterized protein LOC126789942 isoform X1 [Potentilla anserina]XP_050372012.1 uncharacterized protein LOC126789942 isoform X1 [Potentilla anserina]XP_050372020.1 uncharacterized protein LOC126789942 isoform X1 [Potentilla anserina]XP_050372027.1 uncharacterized protein LOC126789942 isoform X1 [Potentilla anserina]XP_05
MTKISTLTAMSLVLWLAMSIGSSWAVKVESWTEWSTRGLGLTQKNEMGENGEDQIGAWLNVLHGAEVALEANKFQTAMAMVAGVVARLEKTNWSDEQKRAKFKEMLGIIEQAIQADNKVKAIALINSLTAEFQQKSGNQQGGPRGLLEAEDEQKKRQILVEEMREAFAAIQKEELDKAEKIINAVYQLIRDNKELCKKDKAMALLAAIHKTEEYIKKDAREKAAQALQGAAAGLGIQQLQEKRLAAGSKVEVDEEQNDSNQERKKMMLETFMRQALTAIKGEQRAKAEEILRTIYQILKNNKSLAKEEKTVKFLQAIEETEKYVKEDAKDKAEQALQGAAVGLGLQQLQEQQVRNRKTASGSEL